jgi:ADP-dependent NAD(P)H-hydrate dehydratase / NAD(P)H-hydrate epimerase
MKMTKVVSGKEMIRVEQLSYKSNKDLPLKYMESAGKAIADYILNLNNKKFQSLLLLCHKGNNSGDAYVCGRYLLEKKLKVASFRVGEQKESNLCKLNHDLFVKSGGENISSLDKLESYDLIIDGLLGVGFKGELSQDLSSVIKKVNDSNVSVISIDVPSGIDSDEGKQKEITAVKADYTLTLGCAKLGLFLQNSPSFTGKIDCLDFGMDKTYISQAQSDFYLISKKDLPTLKKKDPQQHKYSAGLVTALAGSPGMLGAATLSSKASFRSGCGIVKLLLNPNICKKSQHYPELITVSYHSADEVIRTLNQGRSCYIGPGLGQSEQTINLIKSVIPQIETPIVLDADALNIYAQERFEIPQQTIMTPHLGEAARLLKEKKLTINKNNLDKIKIFAQQHSLYIVLKGYPTFVFTPQNNSYIIQAGDPGMATAGSGDVLTGVIASLLAQGYSHLDACLLGVWLHGSAGSIAAQKHTSHSIMASDIINNLGDAIAELL